MRDLLYNREGIDRPCRFSYTRLIRLNQPDPSSDLMVNGVEDNVVPNPSVEILVGKLKTQKGIEIKHEFITGANHFFAGKVDELMKVTDAYLDARLAELDKKT